jgi:hypothetical protein
MTWREKYGEGWNESISKGSAAARLLTDVE